MIRMENVTRRYGDNGVLEGFGLHVEKGEVVAVVGKSDNPEEGRYCVESLLAPLSIVPFDSRCAGFYAKLRADLKRRGSMIGPNDLLIAATALANGATLVTNNVREFSRVKGLTLESWAQVEWKP